MLEKNKKKIDRKKRNTWEGYYPRVTKDKTKYSRKEKHKLISCKFTNELI